MASLDASTTMSAPRLTALQRLGLTATGLRIELGGAWRLAADRRSALRLTGDCLGYRLQRVLPVGGSGAEHRFALKDGTTIHYRLNRGDVRAIGEVWLTDAYRLPFPLQIRTMVDMGANIGLASLWLARHYGQGRIVAVEPDEGNARLAEDNLSANGIQAEVIRAAVGPEAGTARFETNENSTLGQLGDEGREVAVVTPQMLIDRFGAEERISLVKIDIEGAEASLFAAPLAWLDRVDHIVMELHAGRVDWRGIIAAIVARGFEHFPIAESNTYAGLTDIAAAFRRTDGLT